MPGQASALRQSRRVWSCRREFASSGFVFVAPQPALEVDLEAGDGDEVGPALALDQVVERLDADLLFPRYCVGGGVVPVNLDEDSLRGPSRLRQCVWGSGEARGARWRTAARHGSADQAANAAAHLAEWLPVCGRGLDPETLAAVEPHARSAAAAAQPRTVSDAHRMLRVAFGHTLWARDVLGFLDPATVWHPTNVRVWANKMGLRWLRPLGGVLAI